MQPRAIRARPSRDGSTSTLTTPRSSAGGAIRSASNGPRRREPTPLPKLLRVPATVIVGAQWGDEGKGKIVDLLAQDSDIVCRYQGGPNAGHTIVVGDETFKIRALPSGIVRGKPCVIGNGCVVDPDVLIGELDEFEP